MKVLSLAHDWLGHLGIKKVKSIIRRNFYWPNLYSDVVQYYKSCKVCQVADKTPVSRVPMVECQIMTEPHETLAFDFDFVGPFRQAKGGFRFILTCIDQATKWPEAVNATARTIAHEIMTIYPVLVFPGRSGCSVCGKSGIEVVHWVGDRSDEDYSLGQSLMASWKGCTKH